MIPGSRSGHAFSENRFPLFRIMPGKAKAPGGGTPGANPRRETEDGEKSSRRGPHAFNHSIAAGHCPKNRANKKRHLKYAR
jgi:hypothetical protein